MMIDRDKEKIWFPILEKIGFSNLKLSSRFIDMNYAIDAIGYTDIGLQKTFGLRYRNGHNVPASYKSEFTITWARPQTTVAEWTKIFRRFGDRPDFFGYAWKHNGDFTDWVLLNLDVLRWWNSQGFFRTFTAKPHSKPDGTQFIVIPFPAIKTWPDYNDLIVACSPNHPCLA